MHRVTQELGAVPDFGQRLRQQAGVLQEVVEEVEPFLPRA